MLHQKKKKSTLSQNDEILLPAYAKKGAKKAIPKYEMPEEEMTPYDAYCLVHDKEMLDGNARLNLATFVSTYMDPEADKLMAETFDKNMIDKDEYPQTADIELRCVNILANLWQSPESEHTIGCSTVGSSEAAMLAGMAMKWRWRKRLQKNNKPTDKPNLVMGINVQVCWEKFCRYWDVEPRMVPCTEDRYIIDPDDAIKLCDENTIGVIGILGSTYTGQYEPIKSLNDALDKLNKKTNWEIPLHVDAASGGFIAPFIQPNLEWDFRLKWVKSINASGHKYGLVYPGVGWVVWRNQDELPEELIFNVNYLGNQMPNFALNFSRPGNQVLAQYYNFLRLGKSGYKAIQSASRDEAMYIAKHISELKQFTLLSDGSDIPVFTFRLSKQHHFDEFDISDKLRESGWLVPAYTMPKNIEHMKVLRCVIKRGFSREMSNMLLDDLKAAVAFFESTPGFTSKKRDSHGFSHT